MDRSKFGTGKILVVYYSVSGNTARVARDLARATGGDLESIQDRHHGVGFAGYIRAIVDAVRGVVGKIGEPTKNPRNYALTIVGTPVWAWRMTPAVRAWLQRYRGDIGDVAFFVTSGNTDAGKIVPSMEAIAGRKAVAFTGFNERELADRAVYDAKMAAFMRAIEQPESNGGPEHAAHAH